MTEVYRDIVKNGGGTYRVEPGVSLTPPAHTEGYYVSRAGAEVKFPADMLTYQAIAGYLFMQRDALAEPDAYFGAWIDNGTIYLDVTEHVYNYHLAVTRGKHNEQLAIWDVADGKSITV